MVRNSFAKLITKEAKSNYKQDLQVLGVGGEGQLKYPSIRLEFGGYWEAAGRHPGPNLVSSGRVCLHSLTWSEPALPAGRFVALRLLDSPRWQRTGQVHQWLLGWVHGHAAPPLQPVCLLRGEVVSVNSKGFISFHHDNVFPNIKITNKNLISIVSPTDIVRYCRLPEGGLGPGKFWLPLPCVIPQEKGLPEWPPSQVGPGFLLPEADLCEGSWGLQGWEPVSLYTVKFVGNLSTACSSRGLLYILHWEELKSLLNIPVSRLTFLFC